jgi:two-component system response regulator TctD
MLTARGDPADRIVGLELGADDYLPKPFDLDELEARVRALVRRTVQPGPSAHLAAEIRPRWQDKPDYCGLRVDGESGAVYYGGQPLELPPRELALLRALLSKPGHAIAKDRLFEQVFPGESEVQYDAIEVVVYRLRKKIAHTPTQIVTLRGLGYLIKAQP